MSKTKISWTDETANWIVGCTKTRAKGAKESGCDFCYAAITANSARLQQFDQYKKVVDGNGNWNGNIEFVPKVLDDLLKGKRSRRVFAPSMSDPFHPNVKDEWLDQFFATVVLTPHITYQCLTKRPERMLEYFSRQSLLSFWAAAGNALRWDDRRRCNKIEWPEWFKPLHYPTIVMPNLHLGVTVENQAAAEERIPWLLKTPAAKRFLSIEPLLEGVFLGRPVLKHINWAIVGGESGTNARPFELNWASSIQQECLDLSVPFFMKQTGSNAFYKGKPFKTKSRAGTDPMEWPEWARVQEII